jgi:hypothetical protein
MTTKTCADAAFIHLWRFILVSSWTADFMLLCILLCFLLCIKGWPEGVNTFNHWIEFVQSGPSLNPATFTNTRMWQNNAHQNKINGRIWSQRCSRSNYVESIRGYQTYFKMIQYFTHLYIVGKVRVRLSTEIWCLKYKNRQYDDRHFIIRPFGSRRKSVISQKTEIMVRCLNAERWQNAKQWPNAECPECRIPG